MLLQLLAFAVGFGGAGIFLRVFAAIESVMHGRESKSNDKVHSSPPQGEFSLVFIFRITYLLVTFLFTLRH